MIFVERGREMERNVTNVAREAQNRVEHDIHDARTNPQPPSQPPSSQSHAQLPMHQPQNSGHSSKSSKSKKGSKSSSSTSTETDNPSATSKFSRRWSFKKLSMMNKKG